MTTQDEINELILQLRQVPAMAQSCRQVGAALIETGHRWAGGNFLTALLLPTDYDMARSRIISVCDSQIQRLSEIRHDTPNPDMIRAASYLRQISLCCQKCRQLNIHRIRARKAFQCRVLDPLKNDNFRFKLNSKGDIVET